MLLSLGHAWHGAGRDPGTSSPRHHSSQGQAVSCATLIQGSEMMENAFSEQSWLKTQILAHHDSAGGLQMPVVL